MNQRHLIYKTVQLALFFSSWSSDNVSSGFNIKTSSQPNTNNLHPSTVSSPTSGICSSLSLSGSSNKRNLSTRRQMAAPQRLSDNVDGPLYVNSKCINCAACSMFAPQVFGRSTQQAKHVMYHQPTAEEEMETARAALRACPVAAIRLENQAFRNHRKMEPLTQQELEMVGTLSNVTAVSFPRPVSPNIPGVYFVGHHNEASFGAAPYLIETQQYGTILMDSPKYSSKAVETIEKVTGPQGPSYMVLSHVDDTADHFKWHEHYPKMKRVFHSGDLGRHNWIGDKTLEEVEVLLETVKSKDESSSLLQALTLEGSPVSPEDYVNHEVLILHTPGHSPGSITLWKLPNEQQDGAIFTGDTYSYTTRDGGHMTAFPRYGNNHQQQLKSLEGLLHYDWHLVAPGHGHPRDYSVEDTETIKLLQRQEMQPAFNELS